jgi:hypothetical protein
MICNWKSAYANKLIVITYKKTLFATRLDATSEAHARADFSAGSSYFYEAQWSELVLTKLTSKVH